MPAVIPLAIAAGTAVAGVGAAKISSNAATRGVQLQTDAANRAGDLQAQAADKTLAFQKEQAALDAQRFETTQRANYDQSAARSRRLGSIGDLVGLPSREIPAYVSSLSSGAANSGSTSGDPKTEAFIANWQASHPASEGIGPLAAALKQAGLGGDRFMYGQTPSNNELVVGGQKWKVLGGENTPGAYWYVPGTNDGATGTASSRPPTTATGTIGNLVAPMGYAPPLTPALSYARSSPYSIRSLVGAR